MRKKWILWLIIPLCVVILATAAFWMLLQQHRYSLTMTMQGDSIMAVELGQAFVDPGAQAQGHDLLNGSASATVVCKGQVDPNAVGIYRLRYRSQFHNKICTAYRDVYVVESLAPVITLISDPEAYTLPNAAYQEEGYTATDWWDGDITHLVERTEEGGVITYSVTNSAGLTATAERPIRYDDPTAPELVLEGQVDMTVTGGIPFQDPGYWATDNVDGDLTDMVQVGGFVDVYRPGTYQLLYTVTDRWGNTTTAVRNVTVQIKLQNAESAGSKVIYLTFDDGPGPHTERLLDILAQYNVKASFFLVNTDYIDIATRIAEEGHTVAIHSTTHNFSQVYANDEAFYSDLYTMQSIIAELTGQTTYLFRFPGGSSNTISKKYNKGIMTRLIQSTREEGFCYFDWNVDSNDAGGAETADEVFENVTKGVEGKNAAIVLQHDIQDFSVDAVEQIIIWGLANGYTFLPLTAGSPTCAHNVSN